MFPLSKKKQAFIHFFTILFKTYLIQP